MQTKRMLAVVIAVIMTLSTLSVSAEWLFAGYDTRDLDNIGKIYNEKINGRFTNKTKIDPVDYKDVEWIAEGFEKAYPHAGYDRLYIEGDDQLITRYNNLFPQWETRLRDYMWELSGDHRIYQRQQTNIPGDDGWTWDFGVNDAVEATLFTKTTRKAETVDSFKTIGFADLDLNGEKISEEVADMYKFFGVYVPVEEMLQATIWTPEGEYFNGEEFVTVEAGVKYVFDPVTLSLMYKDNGNYILTDEIIAEYVASIQSKYVTGPAFDEKEGLVYDETITKDVAAIYLNSEDRAKWHWDADTVRFGGGVVDWTPVSYEMQDLYPYYEIMVINGVVCDGTGDKPYIYRYTNGIASPNVEWKYISWDEMNELGLVTPNGVLDIVEWKYLDGKPAYNEDGTPVVRIPTGEYAKCFARVTDTDIEIWRETGRGADEFIYAIDRVTHDLGGFEDAFVPGTILYDLSDLTPHLADYPFTVGHCE